MTSDAGQTVALISSFTPSLIRFRGPLIRDLVQAGHRVFCFGVERDPATETALKALGAELRTWPLARSGMNPVQDLRALRSLTRELREIRPDVVLSYTMKPAVYGSIAAHRVKCPRIYSMMTGLGYAFIGAGAKARLSRLALTQMLKHALHRNQGILVYNQDIADRFQALGILRHDSPIIRIGGTGVDLDTFEPSPPVVEPITFLLIARLLIDKGIREYVAAATSLRKDYPTARFLLVGPYDPSPNGLKRSEVEQWTRDGVIEYLGPVEDVRPILRRASVFVLPSYAEGVPRTVQEAMAMARPIITTDAPGCRDTVIDRETGFLVPPKDPAALANAMKRFLKEPDSIESIGLAARRLCEQRFDVKRINERILGVTGLARTDDNLVAQTGRSA